MSLLENEIKSLNNVSYDATAQVNGQNAKDVFCGNWDNAKKVLQAAAAMVKNPIAKLVINAVIAVGDGLKSAICG